MLFEALRPYQPTILPRLHWQEAVLAWLPGAFETCINNVYNACVVLYKRAQHILPRQRRGHETHLGWKWSQKGEIRFILGGHGPILVVQWQGWDICGEGDCGASCGVMAQGVLPDRHPGVRPLHWSRLWTGLPRGKWAVAQKERWCARELPRGRLRWCECRSHQSWPWRGTLTMMARAMTARGTTQHNSSLMAQAGTSLP